VTCQVFDPVSKNIIIGGTTTSSDFGPAANEHGFLAAIDLEGNWQWGKFVYNVSNALQEVSYCKLSSQ
jgi:hypothetical protein